MVIVIAGAGAIGSRLALKFTDPDTLLVLIDDDVVEQHNVGTSAFANDHVGYSKAWALAEMVYRLNRVQAIPRAITLVDSEALRNADLVIDCFDNTESRALTCGLNTLHVGVGEDLTGAVVWDHKYKLPPFVPRGDNPVCTHELGREILRFTADMAWAGISHFLETGEKKSVFIDNRMRVVQ